MRQHDSRAAVDHRTRDCLPDTRRGTGDQDDGLVQVSHFDNPKISVNSRLFDDFDLDKVEVVVIDGKNLW